MQDRYAGDVGDFGKFALLRALAADTERVGVCWYMTAGTKERNNDGRHVSFLDRPDRFRAVDPMVFDELRQLRDEIGRGTTARCVAALESRPLLRPGTAFHSAPVPTVLSDRERWGRGMREAVEGCGIVFLDPDNGLEGKRLSVKSAALSEVASMRAPGRTVVLYHHQTRIAGGASVEVRVVADRIRSTGAHRVDVLRLRPYSSRFYFVIDAPNAMIERLGRFHEAWGAEAELVLDGASGG